MKSLRPSYLPYFQLWHRPSYSSWIRSPPTFSLFVLLLALGSHPTPTTTTSLLSRPTPCSLHHPVFSSRPVTWNCAWIIFSVDKAAVLFFKSPLDRTSTKEWTSHQADFCSAEGENTLMVRDGPPRETMGSPWLHTFKERPDTIWQKYQRSEVLV